MRNTRDILKLIAGAILFAGFLFALMSAPGLLSDRDSTVPAPAATMEAGR